MTQRLENRHALLTGAAGGIVCKDGTIMKL